MQRFIGMQRVRAVVNRALGDRKIGEARVEFLGEGGHRVDLRGLLVHGVGKKLLDMTVGARGNVTQLRGRLYFFPQRVLRVTWP